MTVDSGHYEQQHGVSEKFLPQPDSSPKKNSTTYHHCDDSEDRRSFSSSVASMEEGDDNGRHHWGKKAEYILAAVGYCVGLGNIWRFPYVCMRNGGGAFLIPFFLSLVVCALPVYFLETALGQFHGKSSLHVWNVCPLFKGIGLSMNILTFFCSWYYSIILAWTLIYLGHSFTAPLPWTQCGQSWNTANCVVGVKYAADNTTEGNGTALALNESLANNNSSDYGLDVGNVTARVLGLNATESVVSASNASEKVSSAEEFWLHNVLERSSGLEELGGLPWHTCLALIVANLVVLVGVIKGIRSTGKVVYVTATLPYLLLTIMLILGMTLPGAGDGILFYIKPDFGKLLESQTWVDAFLQVFYSLGTGWGGLITMGSYNKFKNNCMKDSIMLTLCCEGTSVYGGFAIFAILGHMAHMSGVPIEEFAKSGAGLAFIVYPTAISYLPIPQLWGVLFFLMLFTLGLDTQFTCVETCLTTAADMWVRLFSKWRKSITTTTMLFYTLAGMVFASRGGIFVFTLVDWYIAAFCLLLQGALECIIVGWIYGTDRFCHDIELMIGRQPYAIFRLGWKVVAPALLLILFGLTLATFTAPTYGSYKYSTEAQIFGWVFAVFPFLGVIVMAVVELMSHQGSFMQRLRKSCQPNQEWGPADPLAREKYNVLEDVSSGHTSPSHGECHDMLNYKLQNPTLKL